MVIQNTTLLIQVIKAKLKVRCKIECWSLVESSSNHRQGRAPRYLFSHSALWSSNEVASYSLPKGRLLISLSAGAFISLEIMGYLLAGVVGIDQPEY